MTRPLSSLFASDSARSSEPGSSAGVSVLAVSVTGACVRPRATAAWQAPSAASRAILRPGRAATAVATPFSTTIPPCTGGSSISDGSSLASAVLEASLVDAQRRWHRFLAPRRTQVCKSIGQHAPTSRHGHGARRRVVCAQLEPELLTLALVSLPPSARRSFSFANSGARSARRRLASSRDRPPTFTPSSVRPGAMF